MDKTKSKKNNTVSSLLIKLSICAVGVYLVVSLITVQVDIVAKRHTLEASQARQEQLEAENTELRRTLENSSLEESIERMARDKLGYARPDERVFIDMSGK